MGSVNLRKFENHIEEQIKTFHASLNEKEARRHAGMMCQVVGYGGMKYICDLLGTTEKTVRKGFCELLQEELPNSERQRCIGGGRKTKWDDPELKKAFCKVIEPFTAGDPMDEKIKWTNLSKHEIIELLGAAGFNVSKGPVVKLLKYYKFKKRKIQKRKSLKVVADRDRQFKKINRARKAFEKEGNPVISVDTKKKENIGDNGKNRQPGVKGDFKSRPVILYFTLSHDHE